MAEHLTQGHWARRGEACGLRRQDTDLNSAITTIRWQIVQLGWDTGQGEPKTEAGERELALDKQTVAVIRDHRRRQDTERKHAGEKRTGSGFEFTSQDGTPLHPAAVTGAFEQIAYLAGLVRADNSSALIRAADETIGTHSVRSRAAWAAQLLERVQKRRRFSTA